MKRKLLLTFAFAIATLASEAQTNSAVTTLGATGMTLKIETTVTDVQITLTGPSNRWLGIGFGGSSMSTVSDMFIWNATTNRDYTPSGGQSAPSPDATQSWTVIGDTVTGSTREIVAIRPLISSGDYTFTNTATSVPIIYALGNGTTLSSHSQRGATQIARTLSNDSFSLVNTSIYPNPSNGNFTITSPTALSNVAIYTLTGSFVKNIEISNSETNEVTAEGLSSGIYLIELSNGNEKIWKKIVIE